MTVDFDTGSQNFVWIDGKMRKGVTFQTEAAQTHTIFVHKKVTGESLPKVLLAEFVPVELTHNSSATLTSIHRAWQGQLLV